MNWAQIKGNWKQVTGKPKEHWRKLDDHDLDVIAERREQFAGKTLEGYGLAKEDAGKQLAGRERQATGS